MCIRLLLKKKERNCIELKFISTSVLSLDLENILWKREGKRKTIVKSASSKKKIAWLCFFLQSFYICRNRGDVFFLIPRSRPLYTSIFTTVVTTTNNRHHHYYYHRRQQQKQQAATASVGTGAAATTQQ